MNYILLIACLDRKGLIHTISGILSIHDLNIVSNGEFVEKETNSFFMRTEFTGNFDPETILAAFKRALPEESFIQLTPSRKKDIVILATRETHCLGDLLLRSYSNELNATIKAVIANHDILGDLVRKFGIDFYCVSHEGKDRQQHEREILEILNLLNPELIVLAKYMRVLSPGFVKGFSNRIINIHHSFLPAFIGARPYEQAYNRGVKIIGATAHLVNDQLDQGPIISQSVIPVGHSHSIAEMTQAGKDVEKTVLARALKLVLDERVFVSKNKTIIFD